MKIVAEEHNLRCDVCYTDSPIRDSHISAMVCAGRLGWIEIVADGKRVYDLCPGCKREGIDGETETTEWAQIDLIGYGLSKPPRPETSRYLQAGFS